VSSSVEALTAVVPPVRRWRPDPWVAGVLLIALLLALPVITVFTFVLHPAGEVWEHLADTVLWDYIVNTLVLMLGVTAGTLSMGVTTAWLVTLCRFPGRRILKWALLLPLAFPAYIIAYTYTGMFDVAGPVQVWLREVFGWSYGEYWFPEVRSLGGAVVMLSLVLYPYVYLMARAAFLEQSASLLDASRILGRSAWATFFQVSLPAARPAVVAGLSLALMETLADFGTVQHFGVSTFTTGIYRTWFGLGDSAAAAQLAALLMTVVFVLIITERMSRRRVRYHDSRGQCAPLPWYPLHGSRAALATVVCTLPLLFGFVLPGGQLLAWTVQTAGETMDGQFFTLVWHSLALAASAALLALTLALFLGYGKRLRPSLPVLFAVRLAGMGYAVPGIVIAVGVMIPFAALDNVVDGWTREWLNVSSGLLLSGTLFILLFAYMVRFLAVSLQAVEAGLGKIRPSMDDTARTLGCSPRQVLQRVHIPMLRSSLLAACLLVFVDVMKELPATLVLRPFNFNTLAVRAYELASDELLVDAASASVAIVLTGILPVILLSRSMGRRR